MYKLAVDYVLIAAACAAGLFMLATVGALIEGARRWYRLRRSTRVSPVELAAIEYDLDDSTRARIDAMVLDVLRQHGDGLVPPGLLELRCAECARRALFNPRDPQNTEHRVGYLTKCPRCGLNFCSAACADDHVGIVCATARAGRWEQAARL